MRAAFINIPHDHSRYPYLAVVAGVLALGYRLTNDPGDLQERSSLLCTWTPWGDSYRGAIFEQARGDRIVFENGYIPRDAQDRVYYAVGRDGFNGIGTHKVTDPLTTIDRWESFGLPVVPLKFKEPSRILIIGQSAGSTDIRYTMPRTWPHDAAKALEGWRGRIAYWDKRGDRRFAPPGIPLQHGGMPEAMWGHHKVVTWNSKRVCEALRVGIDIEVSAPNSIVHELGLDRDNTLWFFTRLAHCQWRADEIATGFPIQRLL